VNPQSPTTTPEAGAAGLLEKLMRTVRVEFRDEVLVFDAEDPIFGGGACRVAGCERSARGHQMCQGHHQRWAQAGRPDLEDFITATDSRWRRVPSVGRAAHTCRGGTSRSRSQ
jgi:hypothetical protein